MPKAEPARFGVYEVDVESGDLLKDGVRLRIQEQPFKVLRILLARPGEVITREELKQTIAPDSAFGDFDHALNVAVAKLRTALNDSADKPLYIETLHKRGYRFIAPISGAAPVVPKGEPAQAAPDVDKTSKTATATKPLEHRRWMPKVAIGIGVVLIAIAVAVIVWWPAPVHTYQPVAFTTMEGTAGAPAFSPDGTEIAFSWSGPTSPRARIYVQAIGSTVARRLIDDADPEHGELQPHWWPDGHGVVYLRNTSDTRQEIWSVPRSGGAARKLMDVGVNSGFDISPDGKSIALAEREAALAPASIYLVELNDQSRRRLTTPAPQGTSGSGPWAIGDMMPRFSPDGRQVAFLRAEATGSDVYVIDVSGGQPQRLTQNNAPINGLDWAADGRSLLLTTAHDNTGARSLWRFWSRGSRWERIVATTNREDSAVVVARQGRRLAFVEHSARTNIWRYTVAGGKLENPEPQDLTGSVSYNLACSYSPDGAHFAFASDRTGHFEIYTANSDGSAPVQLTSFNGKDAGSPQWSPDGKKIAFDYRPGAHPQIFIVDAAGGAPRQLLSSDSDDVLPHWSRDGNWIYFARQHPGGADLWKLPSTGGTPVLVAKDGFTVEESLDGQTLYYNKLTQRGLYSRPVAGGEERVLVPIVGTPTGRNSYVPFEVTANGIYFLDHVHNPGTLNYYDFKTGAATKMLEFHLITHGPSLGVSPDGKFVLVGAGDPPQSNVMLIENFE